MYLTTASDLQDPNTGKLNQLTAVANHRDWSREKIDNLKNNTR